MANLFSLFYGVLNFLFVAAAVAALVISIIARKRYPKRAMYALIGFGLFAFDGLLLFVYPFAVGGLLDGPGSIGTYQAANLGFNVFTTLLEVGAVAMLVLALFRSEEGTPQPAQHQQYQQPQQQYPGQPYPGQQPQPYQQPQPPQPYPGQQYPPQGGQQYPGGGY